MTTTRNYSNYLKIHAAHRNAAAETVRALEHAGWEIDHDAAYNQGIYAGQIRAMRSHDGYEYCRVGTGEAANKRFGGRITIVMRRKLA